MTTLTKTPTSGDNPTLDVSSMLGVLIGFGMLVPAMFVPDLRFLSVPAAVVLLPSLLFCMR